jgi:HSP20 family protein
MLDVEKRARELFDARGHDGGHELDDWLQAEHEICWAAARLVERDKDFVLSVALPGYEPSDVELTVTPREIIVHADRKSERAGPGKENAAEVRWSDFRSNNVYRRIELPRAVDVEHVKATLRLGLLKITLPKVEAVVTKIPIATAA